MGAAQPFTVTRATPAVAARCGPAPVPTPASLGLHHPPGPLPPHGPGMWGSGGQQDIGGLLGGVGARPAASSEGQGPAAPHVGVGAQPAVHPGAVPGGAHGPQLVISGQKHRYLPLPWLLGEGAATPLSPCPSPSSLGSHCGPLPGRCPSGSSSLPLYPPHLPITHPAQHDAHRAWASMPKPPTTHPSGPRVFLEAGPLEQVGPSSQLPH